MAVRISNGIQSADQARRALDEMVTLQEAIKQIQEESGIPKMETRVREIKNALTTYAIETELARIDGNGYHATLVTGHYDSRFVGTKEELVGIDVGDRKIVPLRSIIFKKFKDKTKAKELWNRVSRRVVDSKAVEAVIAEGVLSVDDVAPCFIEKEKAPYLRIYKD